MGLFDRLFGPPNVKNLEEKKDIEGLLKAVKYKNLRVREEAANALGRIGGLRAVKPLIGILEECTVPINSPRSHARKFDRFVKKHAAHALVKIGEPAVEPLIKKLEDVSVCTSFGEYDRWYFQAQKKAVIEILVRIGEPSIGPLIQELRHDNSRFRKSAIEPLVKIGEPAVEPLIKALKDSSRQNVGAEIEALGRIGDPRAVEQLLLMMDPSCHVFPDIAEALGYIGDKRAVKPLIKTIKICRLGLDKVAKALGQIGDQRALEPLKKTYDRALKEYREDLMNDYRIQSYRRDEMRELKNAIKQLSKGQN